MEISPYKLTLLLVYSFLFGVSAGVFNDMNKLVRVFFGARYDRATRKTLATQKSRVGRFAYGTLIFFQDIFLFLYIGVGIVVLNYYLNYGSFRGYTVFGLVLGFLLYYFTLGRVLVYLGQAAILFIRGVISKALFILLKPLLKIAKGIIWVFKKLCEKITYPIAKRRALRYNKVKKKELMTLARVGFLPDGVLGKGEK